MCPKCMIVSELSIRTYNLAVNMIHEFFIRTYFLRTSRKIFVLEQGVGCQKIHDIMMGWWVVGSCQKIQKIVRIFFHLVFLSEYVFLILPLYYKLKYPYYILQLTQLFYQIFITFISIFALNVT